MPTENFEFDSRSPACGDRKVCPNLTPRASIPVLKGPFPAVVAHLLWLSSNGLIRFGADADGHEASGIVRIGVNLILVSIATARPLCSRR